MRIKARVVLMARMAGVSGGFRKGETHPTILAVFRVLVMRFVPGTADLGVGT